MATQPDYVGSAESVPLTDACVDTVILTEVLEYCSKPELVFAELQRIMKKDAFLLASVPFLNPLHGDSNNDRARYTPTMLREFAEDHEFEVCSIEPMGSVVAVVYDILRVSVGYASTDSKMTLLIGRLLRYSAPLFIWLENKTQKQRIYITTGYSLILRKR